MQTKTRTLSAKRTALLASSLIVFAIILWAALTAHPIWPYAFAYQDKVNHVLAFGLLAALVGAAAPRDAAIWLLLAACCFSLGLEYAQLWWAPTREFSIWDALMGDLGAVLGLIFTGLWRRNSVR